MSAASHRTVRRLVAGLLAAGTVVGAAATTAAAAPARSSVEITRVQYDAPGPDDFSNRSLNREWIEVTNDSRRPVDLRGWSLRSHDGRVYTFRHFHLGGRDTVRIHTGRGYDTRNDLYMNRHWYAWDNHRDTATLSDSYGRSADRVSWRARGHHDDHDHDHDRNGH